MSYYCPTPYQDAFNNRGAAKAVVRDMQHRSKRQKRKYSPVEPYKCRCGAVHLASPKRVVSYGKW